MLRFSELKRAIPGASQKMLIQQLRNLEADGIVLRTIYPQGPPEGGVPPDALGSIPLCLEEPDVPTGDQGPG